MENDEHWTNEYSVATTDWIPALGSRLEFCDYTEFSPFSNFGWHSFMEINTAVLFLFNYACIPVNNTDAHLFLFNP